jgi:inosine-uridine nucleoside N-ribohydrolase
VVCTNKLKRLVRIREHLANRKVKRKLAETKKEGTMNHKTWFSLVISSSLVLLLVVACGAPQAAPASTPTPPTAAPSPVPTIEAGTPVVIDTDMGIDDVMAILYMLQRPEVEVKAITVAGDGLVHCDAGTRHALGLVAIAGAKNIPIACGRDKPLQGDHTFPRGWRDGADNLMGLTWREGGAVSSQSAVDLIKSTIKSSPKKVALLTLGPLTNVAEALQADPKLIDNVHMITIMGGAVDVPGNVTGVPLSAPNRTAEFNIFVDPDAANIVFRSGAPITLVPLDATNHAPLAKYFYRALKDQHATPAGTAVFDLLKANTYVFQPGTYYWWDPVAAVISTDDSIGKFETKRLSVIEAEGEESGRTKVVDGGTNIRVVMSVDAPRFEEVFLSTLNGGKAATIDRTEPTPGATAKMSVAIEGDKCTYSGPKNIATGQIAIDWNVDNAHGKYALVVATLDKDKTFADLDAWPSTDQPPWLQIVTYVEATSGNHSTVTADVEDGPIYIVCFTAPPEEKMGTLGPIEVEP